MFPDKIGSFNVQNGFDHDTAAAFFVQEDLTFLALQEPFASNYTKNDSWQSFQKLELQSARIQTFITPHQVIMYDSWKWGGRVLEDFTSYAHGRVTSISFDLGNNPKIGLISVYASTVEALQESRNLPDNTDTVWISAAEIIDKIMTKWKQQNPGLCTIILGDLQETWTTSDIDNIGKYRLKKPIHGILSLLEDSHYSVVREFALPSPYVTRLGTMGGRGIDHILFPNIDKFKTWITGAKIERSRGGLFFPSDHSYISCSIQRSSPNNPESGPSKLKFDYKKIFNIKLKRTGPQGDNLILDDNQFKDCNKFREQKILYDKLQKKTADTSDNTDYLIGDLEKRASGLMKQLWYAGLCQDVNGTENQLVRISDDNAVEIAYIVKKINLAIKEVMSEMSLISDSDMLDSAGQKRGRLRKRQGFRQFDNLPVPTKIRYLRSILHQKHRLIKRASQWIREFQLQQHHNIRPPQWSELIHILVLIEDSKNIDKFSNILFNMAIEEDEERRRHVQAIVHERTQQGSNSNTTRDEYNMQWELKGNKLPDVSDEIEQELNNMLKNSNCQQFFGTGKHRLNFDILLDCTSEWKNIISTIHSDNIDTDIPGFIQDTLQKVDLASSKANHKISQINKLQFMYRKSTHSYLLTVNKIGDFVSKVLFKNRSAPTTHTEIWDKSAHNFRPCINEQEELLATQEFHGHWMGNSKANETCAFARVTEVGKLGFRGVKLSPNRIVTIDDVPSLINNGNKLSLEIKEAFVKAHGDHIRKLFQPPQKDLRELFYPFYLNDNKGTMNEEDRVANFFWKAIAAIPSKARFDGFQLAVVGRFGKRWQKLLFNIIKLLLVMRYVPECLKKISRFPIPKMGKANEYRPISLCHDLYCFLNGVITTYSSAGIEKAHILHIGLSAYRKGKGCHSLVTVEQSFREDCLEGDYPTVQLDEDEEKFFDRVPVAILLAAMRVNGFPEQGYLEFKASAMGAKEVEIVTCKGIAYARFICGLEQGNPDSPTVANLVIKFKHDVWNVVSQEIKAIFLRQKHLNNEKYVFNSIDMLDGEVIICKIGYCDDNSKFIRVENENDLMTLVHHYLQMAGDLSMATKIGRKGAKCDIQFFNISAYLTLKLHKCTSIAWSFKQDSPTKETVPFRVHLKPPELHKLKTMIQYDTLNFDEQAQWDRIIHSPPHRHLGLLGTLSGDTSATSTYFIKKMKERLARLKVYNMQKDPQTTCINMLVNTMHSYIPLQANHNSADLIDFDNLVIDTIKRTHGLTYSDAKHKLFLPSNLGGGALTSATEIDIVSVARELEIVSNSGDLDSFAFRTRIAAINKHNYEENSLLFNHARSAIRKLARYGIHFRDSSDGLINDILRHFGRTAKYATIGNSRYSNGNSHSIGLGKPCNYALAYGGVLHKLLLLFQHHHWDMTQMPSTCDLHCPIKIKDIHSVLTKLKLQKIQISSALFSYWEWTSNQVHRTQDEAVLDKPLITSTWHHGSYSTNLVETQKRINWCDFESSITKLNQNLLRTVEAKDFYSRTPRNMNNICVHGYNKYSKIINTILDSKSPIIIATDGSCQPEQNSSQTYIKATSAFTVGILDIRVHESLETKEWISRPIIPLLCRISALPNKFGASATDISIAECHAFLMEELCLPAFLPRVIITDSEAVRDQVIHARDAFDGTINRNFIRSRIGGISKSIMGNLSSVITGTFYKKKVAEAIESNPLISRLFNMLIERNSTFLAIAETWTIGYKQSCHPNSIFDDIPCTISTSELLPNNTEGPPSTQTWQSKYFDKNNFKPILKINSHQLCAQGLSIKKQPRYPTLIPNLCLLNANYIADSIAEFPYKATFLKNIPSLHPIYNPPSPLRFYITLDGDTVDKHISVAINAALIKERIKRLKNKTTQGLLWRLIDYVSDDWDSLNLHRGLLRSLHGLSRTHTRCLYKSETYREGSWREYLNSLQSDSSSSPMIPKPMIPKNQQIKLLSPCAWCSNTDGAILHHGNRLHALLICGHPDLQYFRSNVDILIANKLQELIQLLRRCTSDSDTRTFLFNVQNIFISLQTSQIGRLKRLSTTTNLTYLSIANLLQKHNAKDLMTCFCAPNSTICLEIFGLRPHNIDKIYLDDANIGVIDTPWLGLIPKSLDDMILSYFKHIKILSPIRIDKLKMSNKLRESWKCIKGIILGKASGLHKIIGTISTTWEADLKCKHSLEIGTRKELKRKTTAPKPSISTSQHTPKSSTHDTCKPQWIPKASPTILDTCLGISCTRTSNKWQLFKHFLPNKIQHNTKHCTRCSKFCTIMRLCSATVTNILDAHDYLNHQQKLINLLSTATINNPSYPPFMNMLNEFLPKRKNENKAKYTKRSKISDQHKNLCKIFIQAYTIVKETNIRATDILPAIVSLIKDDLNTIHLSLENTKHKSKLRDDVVKQIIFEYEHNEPDNTTPHISFDNTPIQPSYSDPPTSLSNHLPDKLSPHPTAPIVIEIIDNENITTKANTPTFQVNTEQDQRRHYLNEALNDSGGLLSSMGVMRAIEVFRNEADTGHFFASAEANSILQVWSPTEGWERGARIFGSRIVMTTKPDGFYFIPIFDDNHWTLALVQKQGRFKKGFMIDSLGTSSINHPINSKLKDLFRVHGGRFDWHSCRSVRQQEYECGLRMITAILRIRTSLREGRTIEEGIVNATLMGEVNLENAYDSMKIRREAATVIGRYERTMWTGPVRMRNSTNGTLDDTTGVKRKTRRRKRKR